MSNTKYNLHDELKIALMLKGSNISRFAKNLVKPNGRKGVSHTAVIRVAQDFEKTPWIRHEIESIIKNSKRKFPEYWEQHLLQY